MAILGMVSAQSWVANRQPQHGFRLYGSFVPAKLAERERRPPRRADTARGDRNSDRDVAGEALARLE